MLKYIEYLGRVGSGRRVGIFRDGDGDFNPKFKADIKWEEKRKPVLDERGNEAI